VVHRHSVYKFSCKGVAGGEGGAMNIATVRAGEFKGQQNECFTLKRLNFMH